MDATRISLLTLWTVFFAAAVCVALELIRRETAPGGPGGRGHGGSRGPEGAGPGGPQGGAGPARRPILAAGALVLGVSTLVLESMAAG
jgi:hypothetical protein